MKIYTKTGDDGSTGLIGGKRISESDPRIECFGTVDELNAALGLCAVAAIAAAPSLPPSFRLVQDDLFVLGSHLAAPDEKSAANLPQLPAGAITRLESEIDAADKMLPELRTFILPGGTELAARLHVARTVCRRAERLLVDLSHAAPTPEGTLVYLNRLSDWLFTQARLANHLAGITDVAWTPA